jgi:hypothetical protein
LSGATSIFGKSIYKYNFAYIADIKLKRTQVPWFTSTNRDAVDNYRLSTVQSTLLFILSTTSPWLAAKQLLCSSCYSPELGYVWTCPPARFRFLVPNKLQHKARALKPTSLDGTLDETSHVPRAYGTLGTAICNYSPYHWYPAFYTDAMEAVAGLHKDTGPTVSIGHGPYMKCKAIVCHQDVKISICNDVRCRHVHSISSLDGSKVLMHCFIEFS